MLWSIRARSGAPEQPWLEPDVLDYLRKVKAENLASAVVLRRLASFPITWKWLYDLDVGSAAGLRFAGLADDAGETGGVASEICGDDSRN